MRLRRQRMVRSARARAAAGCAFGALGLALALATPAAAFKPEWDQPKSISGAAERLGKLHRAKGATAAYTFIDACYRTHGLASNYSESFESCIVQDLLETHVLSRVYAQVPDEQLKKAGAPTPELLAQSLQRRVAAAFTQYQVPASYGSELEELVKKHGLPVFLKVLFPNSKPADEPTSDPKRKKSTQ